MKNKFLALSLIISIQCAAQLPDATLIAQIDSIDTEIPLDFNDEVRSAIYSYSTITAQNQQILATYITYDKDLAQVFRDNNVPAVLRYASISLSNCDFITTHTHGREGFFYMTYSVAGKHGLVQTNYIDQRRDVLKSAEAFCKEISKIYGQTGDWKSAMSIYASSEVLWQKARVLSADSTNDYWLINKYMAKEYREVYPKLVAAVYLGTYYTAIGYKVAPLQIKTVQVPITQYTTLYQLASSLDIKYDLLRELNPVYKKQIIPHTDQPYYLTIPASRLAKFNNLGTEVYNYAKLPTYTRTDVKVVGDIVFSESPKAMPAPVIVPEETPETGQMVDLLYAVRSGDMLLTIADLYDCDVVEIQRWNKLDGEKIDINQKLIIKVDAGKKAYYQKIDAMNKEERKAIQRKD